jgi:hypothetical protein
MASDAGVIQNVQFAARVGDGTDVAVLRSRSQRADHVDSINCQLARGALGELDIKRFLS